MDQISSWPKRYDAFISFASADVKMAEHLSHEIVRLGTASSGRGIRVYSDDVAITEIGGPATMEDVVPISRMFVLLATVQAAASLWVQYALDVWFRTGGRPEDLLIVVAGGEIAW